ncbi:MAG: fibronectin type III domain-containing protein [Rhodobacteraceae bacterium]|nr:fibronectin type III domain-containing protein [Paracoccaceae bacterium]
MRFSPKSITGTPAYATGRSDSRPLERRSRHLTSLRRHCGALAAALALCFNTAPAAAQVSNLAAFDDTTTQLFNFNLAGGKDIAQAFTTGSQTGGYAVGSIRLRFSTTPTGVTVKVGSGQPHSLTSPVTLTSPTTLATGVNTFTAPSGTTLTADTTYYVVATATTGNIQATSSTAEDAGAGTGWTIADSRLTRLPSTSPTFNRTTAGPLFLAVDVGPGPPAQPTVTTGGAQNTLNVSWAAPTNTGTGAITDYDVRWREWRQGEWTEIDDTSASTALSATITGLKAGQWYEVQVRAQNASGVSTWSSAASQLTELDPAQTRRSYTLLSNLNVPDGFLSPAETLAIRNYQQQFSTGNQRPFYRLGAIVIDFSVAPSADVTVTLGTGPASTRGSPFGAATLGDPVILDNPSSLAAGELTFAAPEGTLLKADTTYHVRISGSSGQVQIDNTEYRISDIGVPKSDFINAVGWSLANSARHQSKSTQGAFTHVFGRIKLHVVGGSRPGESGSEPVRPPGLAGNLRQSVDGAVALTDYDAAQAFTTGSHAGGYALDAITLDFSTAPSNDVTVQVVTGLSDPDDPVTLVNPAALAAGALRFTAPPNTVLKADTTYYVVVEGSGALAYTNSKANDFAVLGWIITDSYRRDASATGPFSEQSYALRFNVEGALVPVPPTVFESQDVHMTLKAWLARFGRTVSDQAVDAVTARLTATRRAGVTAALAGQALPSIAFDEGETGGNAAADRAAGPTKADRHRARNAMDRLMALAGFGPGLPPAAPGLPGPGFGIGVRDKSGSVTVFGLEPDSLPRFASRAVTQRELLAGTSFDLTARAGDGKGGGLASVWGRGAIARFGGREGGLSLDGEVIAGFLGADWAPAPRSGSDPGQAGAAIRTVGLALGHSTGNGGWRGGSGSGDIKARLTGLYPYAGVALSDRLSVWAAAGWGIGKVTVTPEGGTKLSADLQMGMGAAGLHGLVLRPKDGEGLWLSVTGDARFTHTESKAAKSAAGSLSATQAQTWLVRAGIEGRRPFTIAEPGSRAGVTITPFFEAAARFDTGDAETGLGADLGSGLAISAPESGFSLDLKGRALVVHKVKGFREWGASAALAWNQWPWTERGPSLSLIYALGASSSGGTHAMLNRSTLAGLAANDNGNGQGFRAAERLEGEIGYGLPAFGGRFTGTPNLGFALSDGGARDWRVGWRLTPAVPGDSGFEVSLDATRHEPAGGSAPDHGVMLHATARW